MSSAFKPNRKEYNLLANNFELSSLVSLASCLYYVKRLKTKPKIRVPATIVTEEQNQTPSSSELYEDVENGEHQEMIVVDNGEPGPPEPGTSSCKNSQNQG